MMKDRKGPRWWSSNIIDASVDLSEKRDWAFFDSYFTNPKTFDPSVVPVTLTT